MTKLKTLNDIDAIYEKGLKRLKNNLLVCPVCEKTYSNEAAAIKHLNARSCHKMQDVIAGTVHETKAYAMYKVIISSMKPDAQITLNTFRKSPLYNPIARFTMFCSLHAVFDADVYLAWLNEVKGFENVNTVLKEGVREDNLREFRLFAQKYNIIPSEKIYNAYREDLLTDDEYLVRCIEKAQIGLAFLASRDDFPFSERFESLPLDYQNRIKEIAEAIL